MGRSWRARGGRRRLGAWVAAAGVVLILAGVGVLVPSLLGVWHRASNDHRLLQSWLAPKGVLSRVLPAPDDSPGATAAACGSGSPGSEYALVAFPSLPGIEGVAGNGSWALLGQRSVVHYAASPGPGEVGNMLLALHREPNFEPLNELQVGDPIVITNRACQQFTYTVTKVWVEDPARVDQLEALQGGSYLTLITCTPLWIDSERIVIRAKLTSS